MSKTSHKHSSSGVQNYKAQLATAYNELGKELSSTKIKVVGNYTLGKVIGEGISPLLFLPQVLSCSILLRGVWESSLGHAPAYFHSRCY